MAKWTDQVGQWGLLRSDESVKRDYEPRDAESATGFRRPPKVPGCVLDYFAALAYMEDGGKFAHDEMRALLLTPEQFFA